jgi:5-bromo-4-chloroindolyl phosphate hydrolysis protein
MIEARAFEILIETAKNYIDSYPTRVEEFLFEFEGYEIEFIERDLSFFQLVESYLDDPMCFVDGFDFGFIEAKKAFYHVGEDKLIFSLRRKIEFLEEKQNAIASITSGNANGNDQTKAEAKQEFLDEKGLSAKEYALVYILDLFANRESIPTDTIEGGYSKKKIEEKGKELFELRVKPNSFYKQVINISENFDVKNKSDLDLLSKRWFQVVKCYSRNWNSTEAYLKSHFLIENEGENTGEL